jgi:hypothetical protein
MDEKDALIKALRQELELQWDYNHAEHCTNEWPHRGDCHWPRPRLLDAEPGSPAATFDERVPYLREP